MSNVHSTLMRAHTLIDCAGTTSAPGSSAAACFSPDSLVTTSLVGSCFFVAQHAPGKTWAATLPSVHIPYRVTPLRLLLTYFVEKLLNVAGILRS